MAKLLRQWKDQWLAEVSGEEGLNKQNRILRAVKLCCDNGYIHRCLHITIYINYVCVLYILYINIILSLYVKYSPFFSYRKKNKSGCDYIGEKFSGIPPYILVEVINPFISYMGSFLKSLIEIKKLIFFHFFSIVLVDFFSNLKNRNTGHTNEQDSQS